MQKSSARYLVRSSSVMTSSDSYYCLFTWGNLNLVRISKNCLKVVSLRQRHSDSSFAHDLPLALTWSKFPILPETQLSHLCNKEEASSGCGDISVRLVYTLDIQKSPSLSCLFKLLKWLPKWFFFFFCPLWPRKIPSWQFVFLSPVHGMIPGWPHWLTSWSLATWTGLGGSPLVWPRAPCLLGQSPRKHCCPITEWGLAMELRQKGLRPPGCVIHAISQSLERAPAWFNALADAVLKCLTIFNLY